MATDPQTLYDAIQADPQAKAFADAGRDADCAVRMAEVLPGVSNGRLVNGRDVLASFANPADGEAALQAFEAAAEANPVWKRMIKYLDPPGTGILFGHPGVQFAIDSLPVPDATKAVLRGLGLKPQAVTADEVSAALAPSRGL